MTISPRVLMILGSWTRKHRLALFRKVGMKLGNNVRIAADFFADRPERVSIGNDSFINRFVHMHVGDDKSTSISIGNNVFIGPEVKLICVSHEVGSEKQRAGSNVYGSIHVEDGVWIGANAMILPGVIIGRGGGNRCRLGCYKIDRTERPIPGCAREKGT